MLCIHRGNTSRLKIRLALLDRGVEGAGVNLKQQVARLDPLVIPDRQINDRPGHAWIDLDDLGTHLPVAGPGIGDVDPVLVERHADSQQDDGAT